MNVKPLESLPTEATSTSTIDLKRTSLLPSSLRFNPPIKCKEGYNIARKAGFAYLRLRIQHCHNKINEHTENLERIKSNIQQSVDQETMQTLKNTITRKVEYESARKKANQQKKLQRLLYNRRQRNATHDKKWVVNLSSKPLTITQEKALKLGHNFSITPNKLPVAHILQSIIKQLSDAEAEIIRASITSTLRYAKPPIDSKIFPKINNMLSRPWLVTQYIYIYIYIYIYNIYLARSFYDTNKIIILKWIKISTKHFPCNNHLYIFTNIEVNKDYTKGTAVYDSKFSYTSTSFTHTWSERNIYLQYSCHLPSTSCLLLQHLVTKTLSQCPLNNTIIHSRQTSVTAECHGVPSLLILLPLKNIKRKLRRKVNHT